MSDNINPNSQLKKIGEIMIQKYPKLYQLFTEYVGEAKATSLRFESFLDDYTDPDDFINDDERSVLQKHDNNEEAVASIEKFIVSIFIDAEVISNPYYRPFGDDECEREYGSHLLTADFTPVFIEFFTQKFEDYYVFRDFIEENKLNEFGWFNVEHFSEDYVNETASEGANGYLKWDSIYATQHTPLWSNLDSLWSLLPEFEEWKASLYQEKACGCPVGAQDCYCNGNPPSQIIEDRLEEEWCPIESAILTCADPDTREVFKLCKSIIDMKAYTATKSHK